MGTSKELEVTDHSVQSTPTIVPEDENQLPEVPVSVALESQTPSPPPYHVFSRTRKLQMIFIVSLAAIFSPLSSNIYFPALGEISRVRGLSTSSRVSFVFSLWRTLPANIAVLAFLRISMSPCPLLL